MAMRLTALVLCSALAIGAITSARAQATAAGSPSGVLRVVPQANLTILDPIWTTAFVTRNHGYLIYDTLFGTDAKGEVQPQMLERWSASRDQKRWTLVLRDGLRFHDGAPVTAEDVVASIKRWSARDSLGQAMARFVERYETPDARTVVVEFKEPFGFLREALGKPSSNVPFVMPKRIAETPPTEQIKEHIGSGPFVFKADEFKPGERVVYLRNAAYRPRAEPPSGTAGAKLALVERMEYVVIRDAQTQLSALTAGEVDIIEQPAPEQYERLRSTAGVKLVDAQPAGFMYGMRLNFLHPPFNNPKVRAAALQAIGQEGVLRTQIGDKALYRVCASLYPCGTPYEVPAGKLFTGVPNPVAAKALLAEAGYKDEPVVLMRPSDFAALAKAPLVLKQQLEQAGFRVDLQTMDWSTLLARRAKRDAPSAGGWNAFITFFTAADMQNPVSMPPLNATGEKGWFGWQDDAGIEEIKARFLRATDAAERRKVAIEAQQRAFETTSVIPLGQFFQPAAVRDNVSGLVPADAQVYWNVRKN
jgi:peptide/nickel transport system substrate-binding protein